MAATGPGHTVVSMTEVAQDAATASGKTNNDTQKWYTTLPAILGAVTALVAAVGGVLAILVPKHEADPPSAPSSASSTLPTVTMVQAAKELPPGAVAEGWRDYPYAQCAQGTDPAAMAITTKSALVICQTGPGDYYYRGVRLHDDAGIELGGVVRSSAGFDARNPNDDTRYHVQPTELTITTPDSHVYTEPVVRWWTR